MTWMEPAGVRKRYRYADFVAGSRAVLNVGGNACRLIAQVARQAELMDMRLADRHTEYGKVGAGMVCTERPSVVP